MRIADHEDGHSQEWPLVFAYFGLGCKSVAHIAGSNLLCLRAEAITIVDRYSYLSSPLHFLYHRTHGYTVQPSQARLAGNGRICKINDGTLCYRRCSVTKLLG